MNKGSENKVKIAEELMRLRDVVKILIDQFDEIVSKCEAVSVKNYLFIHIGTTRL